jgi:hypothetical protein
VKPSYNFEVELYAYGRNAASVNANALSPDTTKAEPDSSAFFGFLMSLVQKVQCNFLPTKLISLGFCSVA